MPGNLCNVLPTWTFGEGFARRRAEKAEEKIERICRNLKRGRRVRRGFGRPSRLLGGMQRHYLPTTEDKARNAVTIGEGCTGCGLCEPLPGGEPTAGTGAARSAGPLHVLLPLCQSLS